MGRFGRLAVGFLFIALPILEMGLLIQTGQRIGFWATIGVLVGAGLVGSLILSRQSLTAVRRTQEAMARGEPPLGPVLDSLFLIMAGALLIIPGLITDAIALLLLIPPLRRALARWCAHRFGDPEELGTARTDAGSGSGTRARGPHGAGPIIEGEFERVEEHAAPGRTLEKRD